MTTPPRLPLPAGSPPTGTGLWLAGARLRTLPAAIVPVAVGAAAAVGEGVDTAWWRAVAALVVSIALQVGVNFANDYSDGVRGTDGADRVGPFRLVGSGKASASAVKRAAVLSFAVAGAVGALLALVVGPELFVVGAASILAGWTYTGGPKPYGYLGLGEVFVFVFFGIVATVGTTYVLLQSVTSLSLAASVSVGLWATALLVINNLRDIPGDTIAGKRTLAVRIGDAATRHVYAAIHLAALAIAVAITVFTGRAAAFAVLAAPMVFKSIQAVRAGAAADQLIPVLGLSGRAQMAGGLAMALGLALTG